jgi:hypothetical protein
MLRSILLTFVLIASGVAYAGAPGEGAMYFASMIDPSRASVTESLFPHGNIVVFLMLFVLFMIGGGFGFFVGTASRERRGTSYALMVVVGLLFSFTMYHVIGRFTFQ